MNIAELKPTMNRIVLERLPWKETEETTASGIVLSLPGASIGKDGDFEGLDVDDPNSPPVYEAIVISTGPDVVNIKPNDRIVVSKYSGVKLELKHPKYVLVSETDILGVLVAAKKGKK